MLYWKTVNDTLRQCLLELMQAEEFSMFRLVGGTALSLHLGHRMSVDIDMFTDADYGSLDFNLLEDKLKSLFGYVNGDFGASPGFGKHYRIGKDSDNTVKLDLYYCNDSFFQDTLLIDNIRIATVEEIIAMKIDVVQRGGRKKDFWDLHEVLKRYSIQQMVELHSKRYEWTHEAPLIYQKLIDFDRADEQEDPICLKNKSWLFIKEDFGQAVIKANFIP